MKYAVLKALVSKLQNEKKLNRIGRVADSVLKVEFSREKVYFFDLTRGHNFIFKNEKSAPKEYKAPFDTALSKYFSKSDVLGIELLQTDKIICIHVSTRLGYKEQQATIFLELTGKSANAVIVDEKGVVLSALRYDSGGGRELRVGVPYMPPKPPSFAFSHIDITDVDEYLEELSTKKRQSSLENLKSQKLAQIDRKIEKLKELLVSFEEPQILAQKSDEAQKIGDLLLSNAHLISPHQKSVSLTDFDGAQIEIELPDAKSQKEILNFFYHRAKKLRKKAEGVHREKESVGERLSFLLAQRSALASAKDEESVRLFTPKQKSSDKKEESSDIFEIFYKDYKISVGKNRKGNEKLLKFARANDLWFHLKDIPSAHAILHTDKKSVPDDIIEFAAKMCMELSVTERGAYKVDYARRRDVSPVEGSNVNYVNYKTLIVKKE